MPSEQTVPSRRRGRILRIAAAWVSGAAAAVLLAIWSGAPWAQPRWDGAAREVADETASGSSDLRVIDDANPFPAWDERLLALTAGIETVAAARPASR